MRYSPLVQRIVGQGSGAWAIHVRAAERRRAGEDVIMLSVGDPEFDTPAPVVEQAVASLRGGRTHYADIAGTPALRAAICAYQRRLTGLEAEPDQVVVTAGAQCAMYVTAMCLLAPGDEAIVIDPTYVTYPALLAAAGATVVPVAADADRGFHVDPERIARAVTPRTRAVVINSPHNPSGAVLSRAELEAIGAICRRHDLWLVSDEVYASLTYDTPMTGPGALPGLAERTVTIGSLSKSHAMTGWRLGWLIGPAELAAHAARLALAMLYGSPPFIQDAAVTALTDPLPELPAMHEAYRRRRDLVAERLDAVPGLRCAKPEGGMFVMLDIRGLGVEDDAFADRLLDRFGVSSLCGHAFGAVGRGHLRLGLTADEDRLAQACDRIAACAASFRA
ncbi:MAG TPA: pyridoxal phosphate-dependent aminotransferase [Alphaproteobacteria bacterium]|nr:pyridoxal phosphate-dependent aminotransferase [Alphaproteobacteria bacterium]